MVARGVPLAVASDPFAAVRVRCRELVAARRLKRPAVAWVCPELQAERINAMLDALDRGDERDLRASWAASADCPTCSGLRRLDWIDEHLDGGGGVCEHILGHAVFRRREQAEDATEEAERARVVAAYAEHAAERREARGRGEPVSVLTRASLWLAAIPGATSGQGRDPQIFKACGVASAFALPEDVAVDLVLREYAPRCKPVPTRGDVQGKVRRALSSGSDRYGAALARK